MINENCPGAEWNIMCRECCEYDQIECVCPGRKEKVGYTIPCCRNEENECDSCLIHPGTCTTTLCSHQTCGQHVKAAVEQGSSEGMDIPQGLGWRWVSSGMPLSLWWQQQCTWQCSIAAQKKTLLAEKLSSGLLRRFGSCQRVMMQLAAHQECFTGAQG